MSVVFKIKQVLAKLALAILVLIILLAAYLVYTVNAELDAPLNLPDGGYDLVVVPGSSLSRVARELQRETIFSSPRLLKAYARLNTLSDIKSGEYSLQAPLTARDLLLRLQRGEVKTYQVTLLEGWTFQQALNHLQEQEKLSATLVGLDAQALADALDLDGQHPEGLFFPDTYQYVYGDSDVTILTRAKKLMSEVLEKAWANRAESLPYDNAYEALIMASIVERESGHANEREEIAGVFVRRLQKRMRLQTDPTVIYGMGAEYQGNIRRKDLRKPTPYNTYVIKGLPPTPIALPGKGAIEAALNPAPGTALYFVAKGDGSHHFSSSLDEHNSAVRRYQIYRRTKNYRSAPSAE